MSAMLLKSACYFGGAERLPAAATAGNEVAKADLYQKVTIGGSAECTPSVSHASHALATSPFGLSFGPLIAWSFRNRRVARGRITEKSEYADAAFAGFDGSVLLALQQTETALSSYARARDRLNALERAAGAAGKASGDEERLQRFGRSPFLDVLNAQASLSTARTNLVDRQIDLFLALGGGWE